MVYYICPHCDHIFNDNELCEEDTFTEIEQVLSDYFSMCSIYYGKSKKTVLVHLNDEKCDWTKDELNEVFVDVKSKLTNIKDITLQYNGYDIELVLILLSNTV